MTYNRVYNLIYTAQLQVYDQLRLVNRAQLTILVWGAVTQARKSPPLARNGGRGWVCHLRRHTVSIRSMFGPVTVPRAGRRADAYGTG